MICKKCGTECPDGTIFCEACGESIDNSVLPENMDEKGRITTPKAEKKPKSKPKKAVKEKKKKTPEEKQKIRNRIKLTAIAVAVLAVIVLAVILIQSLSSGKGYASFQKIPLGRNLVYAENESGLSFTRKSGNGMLDSMADYDYICVSDKTVKVSGSVQPEWAIMLTLTDDVITYAEYYDFRQLKINWKGIKMQEMLDQSSLDYGMSIKNVNKSLGMKPYYVRRSVSNDSVYSYRYFMTDEEAGYDRVYNFYVDFSDVEMSVKNVHSSEINYARTIMNAEDGTIAAYHAEQQAKADALAAAEAEETEENDSEE